jgi:hypothetical protein
MKSCESNCLERLKLKSLTQDINHDMLAKIWDLESKYQDLQASPTKKNE